LEILKELNQNCDFILALNLGNNIFKKYKLSFYLDDVKLSLNTKYIEV
jgi:hypothetical protein